MRKTFLCLLISVKCLLIGLIKHIRHFPEATVPSVSVLMISPTERRREALRKALSNKPGQELWKFAVQSDLAPSGFFSDPVFFPCEGDPVPLVKTSALPSSPTKGENASKSESRQNEQPTQTPT